ncbi:MAG: YceI family protein [Myxococcales bacterium]|nr:YceI family protein [Myxococcales bacterium]
MKPLAMLLMVLALVGCEDPADSVPAARLEGAATTTPSPDNTSATEPVDPDVPSGALAIDTARSTFEIIGSKPSGSHTIHFGEWSGHIALGTPVESTSARIDIQMGTIEADVPRLTNHLRTDDFFDVEQFPTARFETVAFAAAPEGSGDATHLVTGRLTVRDTTQTITFPVTLDVSNTEVRARAEFAIDRQRWGISYPGMEDDLIRDQVVVRFDVHAPRAQ